MAARIADISEVLLQLGLIATVSDEERALVNEALSRAEAAITRFLDYDPVSATRTEFYPRADATRIGRESLWEVSADTAYLRTLSEGSSNELQIQQIPIRSITSLKVDYDGRFGTRDGSFPASSAWTEGSDFWPNYDIYDSSSNPVCSDGIIKSQGRWPAEAGTVKIVYVSGYTDAELHGSDAVIDASSILEAVIDESIRRFKKIWSRRKHILAGHLAGPITNESLGDYSYSVDASVLARYVGGITDLMPETEHKLQQFKNYGMML